MSTDLPREQWDKWLKGIDFSLPKDGADFSKQEAIEPPKPSRKVIVQKIVTEMWVFTDLEGKAFGQKGLQDIHILGEMDYDEAMKLIESGKKKKGS